MYTLLSAYLAHCLTTRIRCLAHVVNLGNIDVMAHITKIAVVETTTAIWEYDPDLPGNRILGGSLDVIAAIHTLAVKAVKLFITAADELYGPITVLRHDRWIIKKIPWVLTAKSILQDSNHIQQYFSSKKQPMLWRALPAIEELQTVWEEKRDNPQYVIYKSAINDGLAKLNKYYSQFNEKPSYVLSLRLQLY
ncbi:hypothetical protein EDB83DRAFT_2315880 [Lactarius deliciosus]|nr:hypothetical protein EDB83DRAFT_2315880 [Lactarius deliciosus]